MKAKYLFLSALFFLLLLTKPSTTTAAGEGTYTCSWNGSSCELGTESCSSGYKVPSPNPCVSLDNANCNAVAPLTCVTNLAPSGTSAPLNNTYGCSWNGTNCVATTSSSCPSGSIDPAFCNAMPQIGCGFIKFSCSSCPTCSGGSTGGGPPLVNCTGGKGIETAIGCIPTLSPEGQGLAEFFLIWGIGIGGGVAVIMIIIASYMISTAMGDPKRIEAAKELLGSAISGLILLVFSAFILNTIGIDFLGIF